MSLPWYIKILAKLILTRLPLGYHVWSSVGLFRHGDMDDYSYAWKVLNKHAKFVDQNTKWRGLELGPGDGLLSALLAPALNCNGLTLVDADNFAHKDVDHYKKQISMFTRENPNFILPNYAASSTIAEMMDISGATYLSNGLNSLKELPSESFDLVFSQAVLEHIRVDEFEDTIRECKRILKPNGIMSHVIDFKDHLSGDLNNLRFNHGIWEKNWFAFKSGFYTNRLRYAEVVEIITRLGFQVESTYIKKFNIDLVRNTQLASDFQHMDIEDLLISGAGIKCKLI